jgi:hypothetical protein
MTNLTSVSNCMPKNWRNIGSLVQDIKQAVKLVDIPMLKNADLTCGRQCS